MSPEEGQDLVRCSLWPSPRLRPDFCTGSRPGPRCAAPSRGATSSPPRGTWPSLQPSVWEACHTFARASDDTRQDDRVPWNVVGMTATGAHPLVVGTSAAARLEEATVAAGCLLKV